MTPTEAIQILDQVTAQIPLVRGDQAKVLQALQTLRDATEPKPDPKAILPRPPMTPAVTQEL